MPTDFRFTGQRELGRDGSGMGSLMFYGSRAYSPVLGRFISADTVVPGAGNPQALNRYSYVLNRPINYSDPSGHDPLDENWAKEFTAFHHRDPTHYDRMIRLFSLAFSNEWAAGGWDKFYTSDGQLRDDAIIRDVFQNAPTSRNWAGMSDALAGLAGAYETWETGNFTRDIGSLFGGMADRFNEPSALAAIRGGNANHWVWLTEGGLPQDLAADIDGNVHHWAFGVLLGHTFGPVGGQMVNSIREYNQAAGGGGMGIGDIWTNGLDVDRAYSDRGTRADIGLGNRGAAFGTDVGNFGISPWRVRIAYWAMVH